MDAPEGLQPEVPPHVDAAPDQPPLSTTTVLHDAFPPPEQLTFDLPAVAPPPLAQPPADEPSTASQDNAQEHDESDGDEDGDDSESDDESTSQPRWSPIEEDKSEPCEDEMAYITSREEHSALDQQYFEKLAFFDLNDPEIVPGDSGIIEWTIDKFNGTKEDPNNERVMYSPTVRIGEFDWRIKLYPHGHDTESYLSVFVENVTMQSENFVGFEDFEELLFPLIKGMKTKLKKRRSVAAQVACVMFNPAEPRTYVHHADAHQFHVGKADFGWRHFNARYDMHIRQHGQRQAILRNDKLSFRAHIRIVNDPTCCMWDHDKPTADETTAITGLRPFTKSLTYIAAIVPLLHFRPFRDLIKGSYYNPSNLRGPLQSILLKMFTRIRSEHHDSPNDNPFACDVMEMLWRLNFTWQREISSEMAQFKELCGSFHAERGSASGSNRLNTKDFPSIQAAVDNHPRLLACPQLLTLELQRQEHDKTTRKWRKLVHNVEVSNSLTVNGVKYTLFAFVTHIGHLQSYSYTPYVRPGGPGKPWVAYHDGRVTLMTEKQAREKHSGVPINDQLPQIDDGTFRDTHLPLEEVPSIVMYVRNDIAADTFDIPKFEMWFAPYAQNSDLVEPPRTAVHETFPPEFTGGGQHALQEDEERIAALATEAAVATPEPILMDGEDVVMRDLDDDSEFSIEEPKLDPNTTELHKGMYDWLGHWYYEGHYDKNWLFHGGGHLIAVNGDEYLGSFKGGMKNGWGKMTYAQTGDIYEGDWLDDMPHGKGKLTEKSSGNIYEGAFKEGRKHGQFVLTGTVTEDDKDLCSICWTRELNCAFYDCGHVVNCMECALKVKECPVCRRRVLHRLRIYGVRVSSS